MNTRNRDCSHIGEHILRTLCFSIQILDIANNTQVIFDHVYTITDHK